MLRSVKATTYLTPLREGGSLPGLVEADDDGMYVCKFTGAGQGPLALVAETISGELARHLGLRVPDLVTVTVPEEIARAEPDPEIQDLLLASPGINLGLDFLPGSFGFDPLAWRDPDGDLSALILWFDALTLNVDRSWRNPNLLVWHGDVWLIDHGASLYFHHDPRTADASARRPYQADDHVLRSHVTDLTGADEALAPLVTREALVDVLALVPDEWLGTDPPGARAAYLRWFVARMEGPRTWLPVLRAPSTSVEA